MGRRRRGRPVDGWLVIDKPAGVGSTQAVGKARWAFGAQKAGHAGTLDPLATGVLAVAFGEATKTIPYVMDSLKAYRFTIRWGVATATDDAEGAPVATSETRPAAEAVRAALPGFEGEIMQVPPAFSAVKVAGERAYAMARDGEAVELAARPIRVESLRLLATPDRDHAELEMVCGKGGYVRSVARDLGERLGCLGHVSALRRIWSGPFEEADAVAFEEIDALREAGALEARLLPVAAGLHDVPSLAVSADAAAALRQGRPAPAPGGDLDYGDEAWAAFRGRPVAIGVYKAGQLHPNRVLHLDRSGPA